MHYERGMKQWEKEPLSFRLTECSPGRAVFNTLKEIDGQPRQLIYTLDGNNLNVKVVKEEGRSFDVPFKKMAS